MSRLTEEMVVARAKQSDLSQITKLNCWGSDLNDVSIIKRMRGVEVLALSVNKISTLAPFENCTKLQELYLRKNNIQDLSEIRYLQKLPHLKYLWLEENPCCERAGTSYRSTVLRALPNLKKLDNVDVTQLELDEALHNYNSGAGDDATAQDEEVYEDAYELQNQQQRQQQQQQQQQYYQQQQQQQQQQQLQNTSSPPQVHYAQPHRRSSTPNKELSQLASLAIAANKDGSGISEALNQNSRSSSPTKEPMHPPSPKYYPYSRENRMSFHQYDRSPGSDQESPHIGYRERSAVPIPPSISTHSMKEYYQSDRPPHSLHYRHSQTDLTEWEEHQQHQPNSNQYGSQMQLHQRRSAGSERTDNTVDRYAYRNSNGRENGDWSEDTERPRSRRPEGRFSDSMTNVSAAVVNHYANYHRRPVNRNANLLSAALCLVKELDYSSLEVVEHAVRCRIDEMAGE